MSNWTAHFVTRAVMAMLTLAVIFAYPADTHAADHAAYAKAARANWPAEMATAAPQYYYGADPAETVRPEPEVAYSDFLRHAEKYEVRSVTIEGRSITGGRAEGSFAPTHRTILH
jgi:hypothetical protein